MICQSDDIRFLMDFVHPTLENRLLLVFDVISYAYYLARTLVTKEKVSLKKCLYKKPPKDVRNFSHNSLPSFLLRNKN